MTVVPVPDSAGVQAVVAGNGPLKNVEEKGPSKVEEVKPENVTTEQTTLDSQSEKPEISAVDNTSETVPTEGAAEGAGYPALYNPYYQYAPEYPNQQEYTAADYTQGYAYTPQDYAQYQQYYTLYPQTQDFSNYYSAYGQSYPYNFPYPYNYQ